MNKKCKHLAMAALVASSLLATTAVAYTGAIYTSLGDGTIVNANNYENCSDVYLNGGPQNQNSAGLPLGEYYFQVTNPNGDTLLSTTPAFERRVQVVENDNGEGVIFGRAADLDPAGYDDGSMIHHLEGAVNSENGGKPVQLWHFDETPNPGGVYKVWLIPVEAAEVDEDGITLLFASNDAKTDNFRCVHEDGPPGVNEVIVFGRKYYDINANGVYDGGEEWNAGDGRPQVTIDITAGDQSGTALTDDNGLWFYVFEVPEGETLDFTACEEPVTGYNQTGPLDADSVVNGEASATASGGCWDGTVTSSLGLINLNFGNVDTVTIGGVKFYDANVNGEFDWDEVTIPGFKIVLEITYPDDSTDTVERTTDAGGAWSYEVPVGSDVTACEVLPLGSWVQTAPTSLCYSLEDVADDTSDLDFGNVCLGPGGGHTLGFWSNKNGQATMNDGGTLAPELAMLSALNLRKANGDPFDPANYAAFRTWILNATAVNMAYMLSAQLAAIELNVEAGFVAGGSIVWNSCTGFVTINDLMDDANTSLGSYWLTTADGLHSDQRANQECLKNTLDDANNNLNFVQAQPCDVEYPPEE
ncbi:MAG TPA: hypothetical protein VJB15_04535 [Rhodothermia bacterium]|nr:hypothetical protein [Rhodothermia bacterium]